MAATDYADTLALIIRSAEDIEPPVRNLLFHVVRKWTFDCAWPMYMVAAEVDGGNHMVRWSEKQGRHVVVGRHAQDEDMRKLNEAALLGWRVLRFTPQMLDDPDGVVRVIRAAMEIP